MPSTSGLEKGVESALGDMSGIVLGTGDIALASRCIYRGVFPPRLSVQISLLFLVV